MSQLRKILRDVQEEKTLKLLLKDNYHQATNEERQYYLSIVDDQIEKDVDLMLHDYILNYQSNSPVNKKNKSLRWVYIVGNVASAGLLGYAINQESWILAIGMGIWSIINQYLPFIYDKED